MVQHPTLGLSTAPAREMKPSRPCTCLQRHRGALALLPVIQKFTSCRLCGMGITAKEAGAKVLGQRVQALAKPALWAIAVRHGWPSTVLRLGEGHAANHRGCAL